MTEITKNELDALKRLVAIAKKDTGQSCRVANFLLAWWNAASCGGFDPTELWTVDDEIAHDMLTVLRMLKRTRNYPDTFYQGIFKTDFQGLVRRWRPELSD